MLSIGEGWEEENGKLSLISNNENESCVGVAKKIHGALGKNMKKL